VNVRWLNVVVKEYGPEVTSLLAGVGAVTAHRYLAAGELVLQAVSVAAGGVAMISLKRSVKRVHNAVRRRRRP
jgi:hypothetical protein